MKHLLANLEKRYSAYCSLWLFSPIGNRFQAEVETNIDRLAADAEYRACVTSLLGDRGIRRSRLSAPHIARTLWMPRPSRPPYRSGSHFRKMIRVWPRTVFPAPRGKTAQEVSWKLSGSYHRLLSTVMPTSLIVRPNGSALYSPVERGKLPMKPILFRPALARCLAGYAPRPH